MATVWLGVPMVIVPRTREQRLVAARRNGSGKRVYAGGLDPAPPSEAPVHLGAATAYVYGCGNRPTRRNALAVAATALLASPSPCS